MQRPEQYPAPSSSWASLDETVRKPFWEYPARIQPLAADVVECSVTLEDSEGLPFGQVTGGRLVLRAPLVRSTLTFPDSYMDNRSGWGIPTSNGRTGSCSPNTRDTTTRPCKARTHMPGLDWIEDAMGVADRPVWAALTSFIPAEESPLARDVVYGIIVLVVAGTDPTGRGIPRGIIEGRTIGSLPEMRHLWFESTCRARTRLGRSTFGGDRPV
ncbi:hypothetical protein C8Q77DRAFT_1151303 [Trametes polyzona]|nr:hypothetical protein C8Q77DRAFT_1151303 [Trametes polyzona]